MKFGDVNEVDLGAFWESKIALNQNFDITPSIRFDYFDNQYNNKLLQQN